MLFFLEGDIVDAVGTMRCDDDGEVMVNFGSANRFAGYDVCFVIDILGALVRRVILLEKMRCNSE